MSVANGIQHRAEIRDPLMVEWRAKQAERLVLLDRLRLLNGELRTLKARMVIGVCQVCGKQFSRVRPTKLYCSQACGFTASIAREGPHRRVFDLVAIREHLPMLRLLMTPVSIRILENLSTSDSIGRSADSADVSRQRVSQIAGKATKLIQAFRLAQHAQEASAEKRQA